MEPTKIDAVIFDMDGLMIDSEPLWHIAEQECFGAVGLSLSTAQCEETTGLRIDEVVELRFAQSPWTGATVREVTEKIIAKMTTLLHSDVKPLPGILNLLGRLHEARIPLALASSSPTVLIDAALDGLGLRHYFAQVVSAEGLAYGKPHPEVYLNAATALGVAPHRCLALEDSFNGVLAAKAARMSCVAVPKATNPKFVIADAQLRSLEELNDTLLRSLGVNVKD